MEPGLYQTPDEGNDEKLRDGIDKVNMCCAYLIKQCLDTNADEMRVEQKNFHNLTESFGDWEIIVKRI